MSKKKFSTFELNIFRSRTPKDNSVFSESIIVKLSVGIMTTKIVFMEEIWVVARESVTFIRLFIIFCYGHGLRGHFVMIISGYASNKISTSLLLRRGFSN